MHAVRQTVLDQAYTAHPERFHRGPPNATRPPAQAWINQPRTTIETSTTKKFPNAA